MSETNYVENTDNNTIVATKTINAPKEKVWEAWTNSQILDKWWAPKPWVAVTETFNFKEGGRWLYYMEGPEAEKVWSLVDYELIDDGRCFTAEDAFSDSKGNIDMNQPVTHWQVVFSEAGANTELVVTLTYQNATAMKTVIDMGFKEGFAMGLSNLEELLASS